VDAKDAPVPINGTGINHADGVNGSPAEAKSATPPLRAAINA
jgi:hypothetical protein